MLQIFFFHFYNSEYLCSIDIPCQNSAKNIQWLILLFMIFFRKICHLVHLTWPTFILLRPWSQIMLHVKFEWFYKEDVWIFVFKCWQMTHNAHRMHWFGNSSLWPFQPGELKIEQHRMTALYRFPGLIGLPYNGIVVYQFWRPWANWYWKKGFFMVFTIYGHGGHVGHMTQTIWITFVFSKRPWRLYMKFCYNWNSDFSLNIFYCH